MGELQGKIYDQKEHKGLPHISKKHLENVQDFWKNIL